MNPFTQNRWRWCARLVVAWMLVLLGLFLAVPSIHFVLEAILPFKYHWTWRNFFNGPRFTDIAVAVFVYGMPAIFTWAIAWRVRSGRPPHPAWFYAIGVLAALFLAPLFLRSNIWIPAVVWLAVGGFIHLLRRGAALQLLPGTPSELLDRLVIVFPDFRKYWENEQNCFLGEGGKITYCGVYAQFSHYFRECHNSASSISIAQLGMLVSACVDLSVEELRDAATTCFLENLQGEACLNSLRPHLSGASQDFLDQ